MKTCPKCGIALPDEATFCTACGAQMNAEPAPQPEAPAVGAQPAYVPPVYVPPVTPVSYAPAEPKTEPISVGGWMARDLIPCIPVAGGIIYFIMLWVWAADKSKEASFRNWAKSRLIWMAIGVGVGLLALIGFLALGFTSADLIDEMVNY